MSMTNIDIDASAERAAAAERAERMGSGRSALTIDEAAARIGIGRDGVYRAINEGLLRARKFGKRTLILARDLDAFLDSLPELA
jgi:excisionase family DNA binding protein